MASSVPQNFVQRAQALLVSGSRKAITASRHVGPRPAKTAAATVGLVACAAAGGLGPANVCLAQAQPPMASSTTIPRDRTFTRSCHYSTTETEVFAAPTKQGKLRRRRRNNNDGGANGDDAGGGGGGGDDWRWSQDSPDSWGRNDVLFVWHAMCGIALASCVQHTVETGVSKMVGAGNSRVQFASIGTQHRNNVAAAAS